MPFLTHIPVKLLAFDTSTETLSVAVQTGAQDGGVQVWAHTGAGGAQASSTLIPTINRLLAQAEVRLQDLQAIVFGCGPGSFTGLRTTCAVAQGLGFGANLPVLAIDSLQAVAEEARHMAGATRVLALLDARMDEVYAAHYQFAPSTGWQLLGNMALLKPEAVQLDEGESLVGNAFAAYDLRLPLAQTPAHRITALPNAQALLRLAPRLLAAGHATPAAGALPLYVRDKVAQTTLERAALAAAKK
jgi:tRNA threonylcarbamoyladenosine biosynthesis protein TsaB